MSAGPDLKVLSSYVLGLRYELEPELAKLAAQHKDCAPLLEAGRQFRQALELAVVAINGVKP